MTPRFGRKWEVSVKLMSSWVKFSSSDVEDGTQPLRVTFEIWQPANYGNFWYGDISVYNLDAETQDALLSEGDEVIVSAGYENGPYGEIFRGRVMQPLWERENVVDFKTTLHCVIGRELLSDGMLAANQTAFSTQDDLVREIARRSTSAPLPDGSQLNWTISSSAKLSQKKLERGKVMFGSPRKYLDQVARDNYMQWWYDSNDIVHIQNITENPDPNAIVYTPQTGVIGTPQQTIEGVNFRVLLDPRLRVTYPAKQVKLDNVQIRVMKRFVGQLPTILDKDGIYIVAGIRHTGDTRGVNWYTEVTGVTSVYGKLSLLSYDINH